MTESAQSFEVVGERDRAEVLMHPLRLRILEAARVPGSASELARRLGTKPQKVNYHVQRLAEHGFLRLVEERRAGNVVEKVYAATAESYVLASDVLGGLSPRTLDTDMVPAARWLALQARAEAELGEAMQAASETGQGVPTFTMDADFRFETAEQRALFARAVRELFQAIVSKYTLPTWTETGETGPGRRYRLLLGCYPAPERPPGPRLVRDVPGGRGRAAESAGVGSTEAHRRRGDHGERETD
jgi:DNA-binding transcriptional ArsR family regulator